MINGISFNQLKRLANRIITHRRIVHVGRIVEEQTGDERRNVGCVRGHEYHTEAAPHVNEEFVRPRLGRLERDQMAAQ